MKILIATMPFAGHIGPLTSIAERLVALGHDVAWYIAPGLASRVEPLGVTVFPFDRAAVVTDENIGDLFPERARLRGLQRLAFDFDKVFVAPVVDHVADVRQLRRTFPFELLIGDAAFLAMSILGPTLPVKTYAVNPGPDATPDPDIPPPFFGLRPKRGPIGGLRDRAIWSLVRRSTRQGLGSLNAARTASGLPAITARQLFATLDDSADRVFQAGIPETDFPRRVPLRNVEYVGALLPASNGEPKELDPRIRTWPGRLVVVSQGTIDNRDPSKLVEPTLLALEGHGRLVVAVTGGIGTEAIRRRFIRDDVVITDYIPFGEMFGRTDVFVTNGGHGSAMLALSHRVPMVVAGTREGKNDVNVRLAAAGVARNLRTERPKPAKILAAVEAVLDDAAMRERVAEVGAALDGYDSLAIVESALRQDFPAQALPVPNSPAA